jgi:hypothetical protein
MDHKYLHAFSISGQQWKAFTADELTANGFSVGSSSNGVESFIGRGTRKCINGCDFGLGSAQVAATAGVYYLDDLMSTGVFDNSSSAEYLVKNVNYTYKWVASRSGVKVQNALELHREGHRPFYIGTTKINDDVFVGKVRPGEGLFFVDPVTGGLKSTSSYNVLTCTQPDASLGLYQETSNEDWFGSFGCPVRKSWSFTQWRCVCKDEFRGIFAAAGAQWSEVSCSYVNA